MTLSTPHARTRPGPVPLLVALLAFGLASAVTSSAGAQGRCSCNSGCHMFPGQCVQPGSGGCETGFAPFCSTRATSCPNLGWVSCSGDCTCVRIAPLDAGTPDAGAADVAMSIDVPAPTDRGNPTDTPLATDTPSPADRGAPSDVLASMDVRPIADVPASMDLGSPADRPATADVLVSLDGPTTADSSATPDLPGRDVVATDVASPPVDSTALATDTPGTPADKPLGTPDAGNAPFDVGVASSDAPTSLDGGCACEGGGCVAGVCYRDRCVFSAELGFICTTPGTACRLFGADPICVPLCAGVTCASGSFCDERSNGACVVDRCATIACPAGTTCLRNQCGRWSGGDGGVFVPKDVDLAADGGASAPGTATDAGCGCRVGDRSNGGRGGAFGALLVALARWARSRRRRATGPTPGR